MTRSSKLLTREYIATVRGSLGLGLVNLLPTIISSELPWSTRHPGNAASTFIQAVYTKPAPIFAPPVGSHATRGILLAPAAWELGHLTVTWAVIFTKTTGYLLGFMHAIHGALEPPDLPLPLALHIVISSRVDGLVGDLLKGLRNSAGPPLACMRTRMALHTTHATHVASCGGERSRTELISAKCRSGNDELQPSMKVCDIVA
ncbi:hypothetical protein C8Q70DRAFT_931911 [Cubamyces menziesii]|nr:hypothetical protein C8Q70DRAFT_931911 [Cubamyces menziesii]